MHLVFRGASPHLQVEGGVGKAILEAGPDALLLSLLLSLSRGRECFSGSILQQAV